MPTKNGLNTKGYTAQTLMGDIRKTNNYVVMIQGAGNNISIATTQAFLPTSNVSVLTLAHGNDEKKFAGKATWESGTMVFNDVVEKEVLEELQDWYSQVYDPELGVIGSASDYKREVTVIEFVGNIENRREWKFIAWPSSLSYGDLNSGDASLKTISMTLELDPPESHKPTYSW